jgi:hypothetical protein
MKTRLFKKDTGKIVPARSELLFYQTEDGKTRLQVRLEGETVWLTQAQMADLFQTTVPNVSMHVRNVFEENELRPDSVVKEFLTTAADGKNYMTRHFNLDVIISVGYRVKSHRGTQFRIWATQRLREYIVKGYGPGRHITILRRSWRGEAEPSRERLTAGSPSINKTGLSSVLAGFALHDHKFG